MDIGIAYATAGGIISIVTPCSALLVPAVVAQTSTTAVRIWVFGLCYLIGLLVTVVPLGIGVGWLGGQLTIDRTTLVAIGAWVVIGLGVAQLLGAGFDLSRLLPVRAVPLVGITSAVLLGVVAGVGSFCTGPILGAIFTVILQSQNASYGALLMTCYAVGATLPMCLIAAAIRRYGIKKVAWLRGRTARLGPFSFHPAMTIAALVTILVGVWLLLADGLVTATAIVPEALSSSITQAGQWLDQQLPPIVWLLVLTIGLSIWWWRILNRRVR